MELEEIQSSKRPRRDDDVPEADGKFAGGLVSWQNASSRIVRVSRVSGGKDRHSKVWTVKGIRDRRVRLSISTSIQFYDLQDRLGYDQPSKAVDWLINAAAAAILQLPDLEAPFPVPPFSAVPRRAILSGRSPAGDGEQQLSQSMSTCSNGSSDPPAAAVVDFGSSDVRKQLRPLPLGSTSEYFREAGNFGHGHRNPQLETSLSSLLHYGSNPHMGMGMMIHNSTPSVEYQDIHQFSFTQDHAIPVSAVASGGDSNLNFSISSGVAGFTRETLQSNSPHLHHLVHGANLPFVLNGTIPIAAAAAGILPENQFPGGFNGQLHLFGNGAYRHPELKGGRNC